MTTTTTRHWVAIYTRSRYEKRVDERLKENGFTAYLPLVEVRRKWSDRYKMVETPLFSSYVFVRINLREVDLVKAVDGVCQIVSFNGAPAIIPDSQIDDIKRLISTKQEVAVENTSALKKGAQVEISDGPFTGMKGTLISDCKEGNFAIRIDAIGVSLVTKVDRLLLNPIKKNKNAPTHD